MTTIERYIQAKQEMKDFCFHNREILELHDSLQLTINKLEDEIKEEAKACKYDIEAGDYRFQFIPRYRKWIDYGKALETVGEGLKPVLDGITRFKAEVDYEEFIKLCRSGVLPDEARVVAYREEETAPAVKINEINPTI